MGKPTDRKISHLIPLALLAFCASFVIVSCAEVPSTPPPAVAPAPTTKTKPSPTPDPNSPAGKAAEKERNLQTRPASQTGTHL